MSKISEQVKEVREYAKCKAFPKMTRKIYAEAADTIESLSAKLDAANKEIENLNAIKEVSKEYAMERAYGKWIYCGDGNNLPEEPFGCIVTVIDTDPMTMQDFEAVLPYQVGYSNGTWNNLDGEQIPYEVIAWMPAPKVPYHEP